MTFVATASKTIICRTPYYARFSDIIRLIPDFIPEICTKERRRGRGPGTSVPRQQGESLLAKVNAGHRLPAGAWKQALRPRCGRRVLSGGKWRGHRPVPL